MGVSSALACGGLAVSDRGAFSWLMAASDFRAVHEIGIFDGVTPDAGKMTQFRSWCT